MNKLTQSTLNRISKLWTAQQAELAVLKLKHQREMERLVNGKTKRVRSPKYFPNEQRATKFSAKTCASIRRKHARGWSIPRLTEHYRAYEKVIRKIVGR